MINLKLLIAEAIGFLVIFALALFLGAGTIYWPAAWAYILLYIGEFIFLGRWLYKNSPGLLKERMTGIGLAGQPLWDKVYYVVFITLYFLWLILMGMDAVRFHWSHMPCWLQASGGGIMVLSCYLYFLICKENPFLSTVVRIQKERGHRVITTGPYQYVRHPMYAASILFMAGPALLLGSWYGLLMVPPFIFGIAIRALQEERILETGLPGYSQYMAQVRYRFIPFIW